MAGSSPLRLFAHPEKIEAIALLPDDPPVQFRWRRIVHRVRASTGPERIAAEWWMGETCERDYYQVQDTEGARFWLFRDPACRWLHGVFG